LLILPVPFFLLNKTLFFSRRKQGAPYLDNAGGLTTLSILESPHTVLWFFTVNKYGRNVSFNAFPEKNIYIKVMLLF
jgi:hypothetical protein